MRATAAATSPAESTGTDPTCSPVAGSSLRLTRLLPSVPPAAPVSTLFASGPVCPWGLSLQVGGAEGITESIRFAPGGAALDQPVNAAEVTEGVKALEAVDAESRSAA